MTAGMYIKVCGLTDGRNIREVEESGADLFGFIFHNNSPRCVREVPSHLPPGASRVGVFVDRDESAILASAREFGLGNIQLHGSESPGLCLRLRDRGFRVIKAFGVGQEGLTGKWQEYTGCCDMFLFDTMTASAGGSGRSFDWNALDTYTGETPFLLSGGIGPESAERLKNFRHTRLAGYDLNSRFETAPGIKDAQAIGKFIKSLEQ